MKSIIRNLTLAIGICLMALLPATASAVNVNNGSDRDANVKRTAKIENFAGIKASQGIKIVYTQGKFTGEAKIATTKSAGPQLRLYVKNGWLIAEYDTKGVREINGPTIITVSSPNLKKVELSSAASLTVTNDLKVAELDIDLSSAATVNLNNVSCREMEAELSSSSTLTAGKIDGEVSADTSSASSVKIKAVDCSKAKLDASSASKIIIEKLTANNIDADASSAATISVAGITADNVETEASSGANITLKGRCTRLKKDVSSGAGVNHNGLNIENKNAPSKVVSKGHGAKSKRTSTLRVP